MSIHMATPIGSSLRLTMEKKAELKYTLLTWLKIQQCSDKEWWYQSSMRKNIKNKRLNGLKEDSISILPLHPSKNLISQINTSLHFISSMISNTKMIKFILPFLNPIVTVD